MTETALKFPLNTHVSLIYGHAAASLVRNRCNLESNLKVSENCQPKSCAQNLPRNEWPDSWQLGKKKNADHVQSKSHPPSVATCNTLITQALHERRAAVRRLHNRRWPTGPRFYQDPRRPSERLPSSHVDWWEPNVGTCYLHESRRLEVGLWFNAVFVFDQVNSNQQQLGYKQVSSVLLYFNKAAMNFCLTWRAVLLTAHILLCCPNPW